MTKRLTEDERAYDVKAANGVLQRKPFSRRTDEAKGGNGAKDGCRLSFSMSMQTFFRLKQEAQRRKKPLAFLVRLYIERGLDQTGQHAHKEAL